MLLVMNVVQHLNTPNSLHYFTLLHIYHDGIFQPPNGSLGTSWSVVFGKALLLDVKKMEFRVQCIKCYMWINSFVLCLLVCGISTSKTWPLLWVDALSGSMAWEILVWGCSSWHFWGFTWFLPYLSRKQTMWCFVGFFLILPSPVSL